MHQDKDRQTQNMLSMAYVLGVNVKGIAMMKNKNVLNSTTHLLKSQVRNLANLTVAVYMPQELQKKIQEMSKENIVLKRTMVTLISKYEVSESICT